MRVGLGVTADRSVGRRRGVHCGVLCPHGPREPVPAPGGRGGWGGGDGVLGGWDEEDGPESTALGVGSGDGDGGGKG